MSLAEIKEQALALPVEEQAELVRILTERFRRDDPEYRNLLARLVDDRTPDRWVKWEDLKRKLEKIPEQTVAGNYTVYVEAEAAHFLFGLRRTEREPIHRFIDYIAEYPTFQGELTERDLSGALCR